MPSFEAAQRAAAAHVTESWQALSRPAGIVWDGLFVVRGFGLEKAFFPFKAPNPKPLGP
jgi:hypothetical protein